MIYNGMVTIKSLDHTSTVMHLVMQVVAVLLFTQAFIEYLIMDKKKTSAVRIALMIYSFITGAFIVSFSHFDNNRITLFMALIHNFAEWNFIGVLCNTNTFNKKYWIPVLIWLGTVTTGIWGFTDITLSSLIEQAGGIPCDFILLIIFAFRYYTASNSTKKGFLFGFVAASAHVATILLLVIGNLGVGRQVGINITIISCLLAVVTFYFYRKFAGEWDKYEEVANDKDKPSPRIDLKASAIVIIVVLGFVMSTVTFGSLLSLHNCKGLPGHSDPVSSDLDAITVIRTEPESHKAMLQKLHSIVPQARAYPGNLAYEIVENLDKQGHFAIEEKWDELKYFESFRNSATFNGLFSSPYYLALKTEEIRYGPWANTVPLYTHDLSFVFKVELQCGADNAWKTIGDFSNSSYIYGVKKSELVNPKEKKVTLDNGQVWDYKKISSDDKTRSLKEIITHGNRRITQESRIIANKSSNSSILKLLIKIDSTHYLTEEMDIIQGAYENKQLPYLKSKFVCSDGTA